MEKPTPPAVASSKPFPKIVVPGDEIDPRSCVERGTGSTLILSYFVGAFAALFIVLITYGVALILFLFSPLINWFVRRKALALIHGSGVKITEKQFPEIHECLVTFSERLGIPEPPETYIVEASVLNAAAVKFGKRDIVLLTDDLVYGCIVSRDPRTLAFVLGHELGHVALGHTKTIRGFLARSYKKLARLDEYSVDRIGYRLVGKRATAVNGILLLTVGYRLLPYVNLEELSQQIDEVESNKYSKKAEKDLTHPLLLNRLGHVWAEE